MIALTLTCLLVSALPAEPPPLPTVKQITTQLDDLYRADSARASITMKIKTKRFSRTLQVDSWSLGEDLSLMVIRKPARESGTATLRTKEGLWNYAPRADRLMRVPSALLSESWMGSHFTNDDLMRESSWEDDYQSTAAWGTHEGKRVVLLTMIPKKDAAVVYTKVTMSFTEVGWFPLLASYYDGAEVVRTTRFSKVTDFGGRKVPAVMEVVPTDKPQESTTVIYDKMTFGAPIKRSLFTPRGLRKAAQSR